MKRFTICVLISCILAGELDSGQKDLSHMSQNHWDVM